MELNYIRRLTAGHILENEPMSRHTSFKTGGPADYYIIPRNEKELSALIRYFAACGITYYVIGNGSNLLVSDEGLRGVVIDIGRNDGTRFTLLGYEETEDGFEMDAGAGCLMGAVGRIAERLGAAGFEPLSGIPGCLGGACIMNAGAYGGEMKDVVTGVEALDRIGRPVKLRGSEIKFRYRGSGLMDRGLIVTRVIIALGKDDPSAVAERSAGFRRRRQESQPLEYPSAGSTFKRPEGYFAGKLISDAGLKGYSVGGAAVSEKHAGFVINKGGATTADVLRVMEHCREEVMRQFGVELVPEVRLLGF